MLNGSNRIGMEEEESVSCHTYSSSREAIPVGAGEMSNDVHHHGTL